MDNREFSHFSVDDYVVGRVNDSYIEFFNVDKTGIIASIMIIGIKFEYEIIILPIIEAITITNSIIIKPFNIFNNFFIFICSFLYLNFYFIHNN